MRPLVAILLVCLAIFLILPLAGSPPVTRVSIVLLAGVAIALAMTRPWRWPREDVQAVAEYTPSSRAVWTAAVIVGLVLFWFVLTRFRSGEINAIDFTVYYDRPTFQTLQGRLMYVESADDVIRAQQTYLSVHAHWIMIPLAGLYAIQATPLWLLALSVVAVVAGAFNVLRILQRLETGGLLAVAGALAFVLNDNTARTLNYGFHVEVLYAWLIPWQIHAALARQRWRFLLATILCVAVKEDAFMLLGAASVTLALIRFRSMDARDRVFYLVTPFLIALINLGVYYGYLLPALRQGGSFYANYWESYGRTPLRALFGLLASPWRVLTMTLGSGLFARVLAPHLFLPIAGWRWTLGIVPIVLLYGASDNEQLRSFGIYYAIVLVPFLVIGSVVGGLAVAGRLSKDPVRVRVGLSAALVLGALFGGITDAGYSLRPWKSEIAAVPRVLADLGDEPVVLVQSGLYPHAGYDARTRLLTPDSLANPENAGAAVILAPRISAWPLSRDQFTSLTQRDSIRQTPAGLLVIRVPQR